jgi:predicted nuclease of predicted toxin-antitoxin system
MKFLFDQSADFRLIAHLRHLGHDVSAISQDHPHSLADEDVLAIARNEQRILVVADRDFGELIFHQGLAHTGVIFFRLPGASLRKRPARYVWRGDRESPMLCVAGDSFCSSRRRRLC